MKPLLRDIKWVKASNGQAGVQSSTACLCEEL